MLSKSLVTVAEDGGTDTYTVRLNTKPTNDVIVYIASSNTSVAMVSDKTLTFTPANWFTTQPITVTGMPDEVDNAGDSRLVTIIHTPAGGGYTATQAASIQVWVTDADDDKAALTITTPAPDPIPDEHGGTAIYKVSLATKPTSAVIVYVTSENTNTATVSPSSITFLPTNWDEPQRIIVIAEPDDVDNPGGNRSVKITNTASGGGYDAVPPKSVTVTVADAKLRDDDEAGLTVTPGTSPTDRLSITNEDGGTATYTVKLTTEPKSNVTVHVVSGDPDIATVNPLLLTFTPKNWSEVQEVTVTGTDDDVDNDPEFRELTITNTPSGGGYGAQVPVHVRVKDTDAQGLDLSRQSVRVREDGGTSDYTVKLNTKPSANVDVTVTGETGIALVSRKGGVPGATVTLTFTSVNWPTNQVITVTGVPDEEDNLGGDRRATITNAIAGGISSEVQVTVTDDEDAEMVVAPTKLTVADDGSEKEYMVTLRTKPRGGDVTVSVTPSGDMSAVSLSSTRLTFSPTEWGEGVTEVVKTVTVTGVSDAMDNPRSSRSVTITNTPSGGGYDEVESENVTVTVDDTEDTADTKSELTLSGAPIKVTDKEDSNDDYTVKLNKKPTGRVTVTATIRGTAFPALLHTVNPDAEGGFTAGATTVTLTFETDTHSTRQTVRVTGEPNKTYDGGDRLSSITHEVSASGVIVDDDDDDNDNIPYSERGKSISVSVVDDDKAGLELSEGRLSTTEGETESYAVVLTSEPSNGSVLVDVVSSDPSIATVDKGTLTFSGGGSGNWEIAQTVTVTGINDSVDNARSRPVRITHTPRDGGYEDVEPKSVPVTVADGKKAAKLLTVQEPIELDEDGGTGSYDVRLSTRPTDYVTVGVESSDGNVATVRPALLTFTPVNWASAKRVTVTGVRGGKATITHDPTGGGYSNVRTASVKVTVLENESPGLRVTPLQVVVAEGKTETYKVELKEQPSGPVTVSVRTNESIATVNPSSLTFTRSDWDDPQTVRVTGVDDSVIGDRHATITNTSSGSDYNYEEQVEVTVTDNDAVLLVPKTTVTVAEASGTDTYTVVLKGRPPATEGDVTVAVTISPSGVATVKPSTLTFTTANWSTAQTVTVTGVNDNLDNAGGNRTATITNDPSGGGYDEAESETVTVTVTDDEGLKVAPAARSVSEAGGSSTYTVSLATQPPGNVTVAVASSDTTVATVKPSTLTFTTANWSTAQTVTVTGVNDNLDNAGDSRSATISHTSSGYIKAEVTVTVTDDDDAPSGIELAVEPSTVEENAGATVVTVTATVNGETRYGVSRSVMVAVGASDDSATKGTDYQTVANFPVPITAGAASGKMTFTLTPVDDTEFERTETITVAGTLSGVKVTPASITLTDNDTPPTLSIGSPAVQEGAADTTTPLRFPVTLSKATAQAVTVKYAESAGGTAEAGADYEALTAGTLTFAAGDTKKTITVTVKGDDMDEDDETLKVMLSSPTTATIATGTGTGTIRDDDEPPELSIKGATVAEGHAGTTTPLVFTVTKDGATSKEVTVDYKVSGGTAKRGEDYTAPATGTLTFNPDQATRRITITVKGDNVQEDDETIEIALQQPPKNATLAAGKSKATGTITDDDVLQTVAKDWMARFGRTAAAATVDAIAIRMNDAASSAGEDHSLTLAGRRLAFAGAAPLPLQAAARIEPWEEGATSRITLQDLAEDSAFDLGRSLAEGYLSVWAASSYHQFEKTSEYTLDGNLVSAILGADHAGDHHVAGMALAYHGGGGEYGDLGEDDEGELTTALYSFHPYVRLTIGDYFHIGGSFGAGTGSMNIKPAGGKEVETSMTMTALGALDARLDLNLSPGWLLAVQADAHTVHMVSAEKKPELPELATATNRIRLGLESSYAFLVGEGMSLAPTVEAGVRHDGGDAETGLGLDAGGGLRFTAAAIGLMVDARGHAVLSNFASDAQTGDAAGALREWGLGGMIRWRPDFGGHGPEVTLAPSYGAAAGGLNPGAIPSLDAEFGYRLPAFGGVLTPYSSAEFAGSGQRSYRAGAHLEFGHAVEVSAEGTYQQSATGDAEQFLTLRARLRQ